MATDPVIGIEVGNFRIIERLAEGGLGVVYRAEHLSIGRQAAVKVLKAEYTQDPATVKRFEQEARAVSRIRNPHLIDIFDIGTMRDGRLYYVMELLEGRSLATRMSQGTLPFSEVLPLMIDACDALQASHAVGVVHRDLKPDNLFIVERRGEPKSLKVLDFGVAKLIGTGEELQSKLTRTGMILGTPQYMAPEQIEGGTVDHRADIYSLGVILYELATGSLPFRGNTIGQMLKAHLLQTPPVFEPWRLAPGVPDELEPVVMRALAKDPGQRQQSVAELRSDLEQLAHAPPSTRRPPKIDADAETHVVSFDGSAPTPAPLPTLPPAGAEKPTSGAAGQRGAAPRPTAPKPAAAAAAPRSRSRNRAIVGGALFGVAVAAGLIGLWLHRQSSRGAPASATRVASTPAPAPPPPVDISGLRSRALAILTTGLRDGDPALRRHALEMLALGQDERSVSLVEPMLDDADLEVRAAAATTLATLGGRSVLPLLRPHLKPSHRGIDLTIAETMARLGDRDVKKLLKNELKHGDERARMRAALALEGDADARALLQKRLQTVDDAQARVPVLVALARGGDASARDHLVEALDQGSERDQLGAAQALARLGDERGRARLTALTGSSASTVRLVAFRALAGVDDQSGFDTFGNTLTNADASPQDRAVAAQGLGASGDKGALKKLQPALDDAAPIVRLSAAGAILSIVAADPKLMAEKSLDWATSALSDDSWTVRQQAVSVLADAEPRVSVPLLGRALHDREPEVRRAAASSLGKTKAVEAVPLLTEALEDKKDDVRVAALRSMGKIGHESAKPALKKHLERASSKERVVAAGQLAKLGDHTHVDEIKSGLSSPDPAIRKIAVQESVADAETESVATTGALKDKAFEVRYAAALQLADKGSKEGVGVLQEAVKKGGAEGVQAWAALEKLGVMPAGKLDTSASLQATDPAVRVEAVEAAARLPVAVALEFFTRALRDPEPRVRVAVLDAVTQLPDWQRTPSVQALLKRALDDADPAVRAMSQAVLARVAPDKETKTSAAPAAAPVADMSTPRDMTQGPDLLPAHNEEAQREEGQLAMTEGELALKSGRLDVALRELQKAHRLDPHLPVAFSLAETYRKLGERETNADKQREAFTKAVSFYQHARDKKAAAYAAELQERLKGK